MTPAASALASALLARRPDASIVPQRPDVPWPSVLTGGAATIGLRVPDHDAPRALAREVGPSPDDIGERVRAAGGRRRSSDRRAARRGGRSRARRGTGARRPGVDGRRLHAAAVPGDRAGRRGPDRRRSRRSSTGRRRARASCRPTRASLTQPFRPRASTRHVSTSSPPRDDEERVEQSSRPGRCGSGRPITTRPTSGIGRPSAHVDDPVVVGDARRRPRRRAPGSRRGRGCRRRRPCSGSSRRRRSRTAARRCVHADDPCGDDRRHGIGRDRRRGRPAGGRRTRTSPAAPRSRAPRAEPSAVGVDPALTTLRLDAGRAERRRRPRSARGPRHRRPRRAPSGPA